MTVKTRRKRKSNKKEDEEEFKNGKERNLRPALTVAKRNLMTTEEPQTVQNRKLCLSDQFPVLNLCM